MGYRKFKADYLFTGHQMLGDRFVLITTENGRIVDIVSENEASEGVQTFQGILCPGFVNCHCHLELSHLKGRIPEKTGLVDFVLAVISLRQVPVEEIYQAISAAEEQMLDLGIVAVGDICNNRDTLIQKQKQRLLYYNFIEVSGWIPKGAAMRFATSKSFYDQFLVTLPPAPWSQVAMVPHAPYSVSDELWNLLTPYFIQPTTSIHNQETPGEDELFKTGEGDLLRMYKSMNLNIDFFQPTAKSSLASWLPKMEHAKHLLLVHNTFTKEEDLTNFARMRPLKSENFFCLCVNANLYIESSLPPIELFLKHELNLVMGTDSLASNHQLDLLAEMKTIMRHYPLIGHAELLKWSTINGAKALHLDHEIGSFEKGKRPGVVVLEKTDGPRLTQDSRSRRVL
jgi:aminodeoxyfutalosine deaminase